MLNTPEHDVEDERIGKQNKHIFFLYIITTTTTFDTTITTFDSARLQKSFLLSQFSYNWDTKGGGGGNIKQWKTLTLLFGNP